MKVAHGGKEALPLAASKRGHKPMKSVGQRSDPDALSQTRLSLDGEVNGEIYSAVGRVQYSVFAHRRIISTQQAALSMMGDWSKALFSQGYSGMK